APSIGRPCAVRVMANAPAGCPSSPASQSRTTGSAGSPARYGPQAQRTGPSWRWPGARGVGTVVLGREWPASVKYRPAGGDPRLFMGGAGASGRIAGMSAVISTGHPQGLDGATTSPLAAGDGGRPVAFGARTVALADFLAEVRGVAALLPDRPYVVNLCEDRYRFLVAFAAAAVRGQVTLLPPARTRAAIDEVRAHHPESYCLGDADACGCEDIAPLPHYLRLHEPLPRADGPTPRVADAATVAIGYTSGSTGTP